MKKNVLILTARKLDSAPRVIREVKALEKNFNIHLVGIGTLSTDSDSLFVYPFKVIQPSVIEKLINSVSIKALKTALIDKYPVQLYKIKKLIKQIRAGYIITHEPDYLPILAKLKNELGFKIIFNSHEYYPHQFEDQIAWKKIWQSFYKNIYKNFLPSVDLFINVCEGISKKCKEEFGADSIIIPNACFYYDLRPSKISDGSVIRIIYHGGGTVSRKIVDIIEVGKLLDDKYQVDLMLTVQRIDYYEHLKKLASQTSNVRVIDTVKFNEIVPFTNKYDIGIFLLPAASFNSLMALPNKLFEFIQARLCIAISPNPEMVNYVDRFNLGVVSDEFTPENIAKKILELNHEDIYQYKLNAHKVAKQLSAENYNEILLNSVLSL